MLNMESHRANLISVISSSISQELSPDVYCRYRPTRVPYAFVKEEVLNLDPRVMVLHEVISEKDMQLLKKMSMAKVASFTRWWLEPQTSMYRACTLSDQTFYVIVQAIP